jgi:hypothetical protein
MEGQNEESEGRDAGHAMEAFFTQFGEMDVYASIVLEEFFRELMGSDG